MRVTPDTRYRAVRHLEAGTERGTKGWLSAVTEFDAQSGFRYHVMSEGGSERIRNRVLRRILEAETEWTSKEEASKAALTDLNYVFQSCQPTGDLVRVSMAPRRKESRLVDGELFLTPEEGLVRLEGTLAKSPSFWIRRVDVVWLYRAIEGVTLPVHVESTADVRFVGRSTFAMTYDYQMVNGQPIAANASE